MSIRIPDLRKARIAVAGDVMLDRYWYGPTSRISPEAPVPVVRIADTEDRLGGAANVALGLTTLGAQAYLLGQIGGDSQGDALQQAVAEAGIRASLLQAPGRDTITKLRVISRHQQMIRLDFEEPDGLPALPASRLREILPQVDAVVLSDYAKGTLRDVGELIAAAREAGKPVLVDPKQPDLSVYRGATVITPNRQEFERAAGPCHSEDELVARGLALAEELDWQALIITRGDEGMTLLQPGEKPVHIPAQAQEVFDVTGAGDTVIAVLAAALAVGETMVHATTLANIAAGVVVGKLGTATVKISELQQAIRQHDKALNHQGIVSQTELLTLVRNARDRGERIVMTNGCFDILHPGHIAYLNEARELGDRLIVAVNTDESVRRLKGADRPINTVEARMAVLGGLRAVDWVVAFSENTPAELIERILPDVLVKGGDYQAEDVAGGEAVRAGGGEVTILRFRSGHSTSGLIEAIKGR